MLPIYTIPDKIDNQIIEWISWNYSENINEQHLLFLRHLSAIKFGILNNKEYYIIQDSEFTPVPNTTIAIEYLKDKIEIEKLNIECFKSLKLHRLVKRKEYKIKVLREVLKELERLDDDN